MRVETIGRGEPELSVVGLVHGDEICGLRAINRFKEDVKNGEIKIRKPVKLVLANERAFNRGKRYIEADLNRSFPGDPESENYEERLAYRLRKEIEGTKVLDLHASESPKTPFALISGMDKESYQAARQTCMETLVEISFVKGGLINYVNGVCVECGFQNRQESSQIAYYTMLNFLAANEAIEENFDLSNPGIFKVYDKADGSNYEFLAENFLPVEKDEVYARNEEKEKRAQKQFYPVLMSSSGYDDMIGFKAAKLSDDEIVGLIEK